MAPRWVSRLVYNAFKPRKHDMAVGSGQSIFQKSNKSHLDRSSQASRPTRSASPRRQKPPESPKDLVLEARAALRRRVLFFLLVMLLCLANIIVLDVLWFKEGNFSSQGRLTYANNTEVPKDDDGKAGWGGAIEVD
ncbi:hypothetical protein BC832DRAFT_561961 [Gaertneriomyces semiglobifer]|nr:hypothetical protein BC832DRAFT_561961 [Gaertneriomyces semiglobifer]